MATQNKINSINMSRVLRYIWLNRGTSRVEMCARLGLNKSTVTKNVQQLLDRGMVEVLSEGAPSPQGGRRPVYLGIRPGFCYVMGLEIQTEFYRAVITDARGQIVFSRSNRLKDPEDSLQSQFRQSLEELAPFIEQYRVCGIGLGLSGIINSREGTVLRSLPFGIQDPVPFGREAGVAAGLPVLLENDANCCCWGDLAGQKSSRHDNMLFVLSEFRDIDTRSPGIQTLAVGLGMVLGGEVHHGRDFSAGEFTSVFREKAERSQFSLDETHMAEAAEDPDVLGLVVSELSRNLSLLVNSLNITRIVVGGALAEHRELTGSILSRTIQDLWPYANPVDCVVEFSPHGDNMVAYGAAGLFLERIFGLPDVEEEEIRGWDFIGENHLI